MSKPVSGNHNDLFDIEVQFEEVVGTLKEADAGFDSQKLRDECDSKGIIANIYPNKRMYNLNETEFTEEDPYKIFQKEGADLVRLRVWVNPNGGYRGVNEVVEACKHIVEANEGLEEDKKMKVMINFHYSDTWTDPEDQWMPQEWREAKWEGEDLYKDWTWVGEKIYQHTLDVLNAIDDTEVNIAYVQVGNESDSTICDHKSAYNRDWNENGALNRASQLLKSAVQGVKDSKANNAKIIIHHSNSEFMAS